jgi:2-octaprenyl-6-methoxyphenol hydroxylase
MHAERHDVLISGASFAGLALALALAETLGDDLRILVADRGPAASGSSPPATDSRASAISAASKRLLTTIGVWPLVAAEAQPVSRIEITDSSLDAGIRPVQIGYDNAVDGGEPATWIVPNAALLAALETRARARPGMTRAAGRSAVGLEAGHHDVGVRFDDGEVRRATLVVAADGRRSTLREAAGIKIVGWNYDQTGIVTTVAHERPHGGTAVQHFLPAGPFAILPLTGNRSCITWSESAAEAARILALDDTQFLDEIDLRFGGKLGPLSLATPPGSRRQSWPLEMHLARRYVAPRLALVGDAAHGVHPIAGQGLNLGLRDVAALVEVLADAARLGLDIGNADTLLRYERWRRFDATISTAAYDGLNRLFSNDWTLLRAARDLGLGLVDRMPGLKQLLVHEAAGLTGELPRLLRGERA